MAVRLFDATEPESLRLRGLEAAPLRRRELRRIRHRYAVVGVLSLSLPFIGALVVLGVSH